MLVYGLWQDANSPLKYTDIDYLVFTDAARFTFSRPAASPSSPSTSSPLAPSSPYTRETYRYTPLLAWLLYPTTLPGTFWFSSGKVLFAAADLLAGWLLLLILRRLDRRMPVGTALGWASIWLLNPMVAAISTRGSSEGLLGVLVTALLWAVLARRVALAGLLLGLGVHFKIYPFIYAPAIVWWMDAERMGPSPRPGSRQVAENKQAKITKQEEEQREGSGSGGGNIVLRFFTRERLQLAGVSLATFLGLNAAMYARYGAPFVAHTFLHHVTRIDHRHNFSPYNVLLYLTSAEQQQPNPASAVLVGGGIESLAFLPQLLLSTVLIPLVGAKRDLPATMLAQTFAFVTFNKVCTSQYFLWYMVLLPLYLPTSSLAQRPATLGLGALALWAGMQALWLREAYALEFLGLSTFVPGLWLASLAFFLANCWILGVVVDDLGRGASAAAGSSDVAVDR
ncbi:hypothetical protein DL768_001171 [Monosporascus sp. mg162]|nr:hypothetical protein DL768_001171 [Monosporascus sp. mg162]